MESIIHIKGYNHPDEVRIIHHECISKAKKYIRITDRIMKFLYENMDEEFYWDITKISKGDVIKKVYIEIYHPNNRLRCKGFAEYFNDECYDYFWKEDNHNIPRNSYWKFTWDPK